MFDRCSRIQWKLSRALDNGEVLPPSVEEHCDQCASCSSYLEVHQKLSILRSKPEADPTRHQRIMRTIRNAEPEPSGPFFGLDWQRFAPAGVGALAVLAMGYWLVKPQPVAPTEPAIVVDLMEFSLPDAVLDVATSSYEQELKHLRADLIRSTMFLKKATRPIEDANDDL